MSRWTAAALLALALTLLVPNGPLLAKSGPPGSPVGALGSDGDETRHVDELFEHFVPAAGDDRNSADRDSADRDSADRDSADRDSADRDSAAPDLCGRALTYHVTLGDRVIYSERRAWDPVAGDYVSSKRYLHHDHLGSVNVITDESQSVLHRAWFDAFGLAREMLCRPRGRA